MYFFALACLFLLSSYDAALAQISVFNCKFKGMESFVITSYEDDNSARIGIEQGIGNKGQSYYDKLTGAWIFVEYYSGGSLPDTLTTILSNGNAYHSRHIVSASDTVMASQLHGICTQKIIK
jgi:hypothetical protein